MSDAIDLANALAASEVARSAAAARAFVAGMPAGHPGECSLCGEHSARLVGGACAPCRDAGGLA